MQLANPKAAVFMIAFYPQFVPLGAAVRTTAVLALLQVCIELCFYFTLAAFVARAGAWFRRSTVRRRLEAVSGTVLVGLGLRVAAQSRPGRFRRFAPPRGRSAALRPLRRQPRYAFEPALPSIPRM